MAATASPIWLKAHVDGLARVARELRGVPHEVATQSATATLSAFSERREAPERIRARSERYFWRVVSRRLMRTRSANHAISRFIVATVVEDLVSTGRDSMTVWCELERGWADKVPKEVLEEYRARLCA